MKSISTGQYDHILFLLDSGKSGYEIKFTTGISASTISHICSQYHSDLPKALRGCPSKVTDTNICHAMCLVTSGKVDNAVQVAKALQTITNQTLSSETIRLHLKKAGMKAVVKKKYPLLTKHHTSRKERLDFALSHQDWTMEDWKRVVWSDETKINRLGSDGRKWVWKKAGEGLSDRLVEGTKKFGGGSVMVWGCMMWDGTGVACKIDGRMDGDLYCQILEDELQDSLAHYGKTPDDILFQQDNDPKHTCKKAKNWFNDHGFEVMLWPAQSHDLNPIENLWHYLKRKLGEYEYPPNCILELWERIQKEWNAIPASVC